MAVDEQTTKGPALKLFPNPVSSVLNIETTGKSAHDQLSVMNLSGRVVLTCSTTGTKTQLDISSLPGGVYFVRLINNKTVETGKFVKL